VNSLIARKLPPPSRDDDEAALERAAPLALVAVSGLRQGSAMEPTLHVAAPPTPNPAVAANGASIPGSVFGAQRGWSGTNPNQPDGPKAPGSDPSLVVPVIASGAEVSLARKLREQLRKKYLNNPSQPCSPWWVGID